jgi:hypothetical protein
MVVDEPALYQKFSRIGHFEHPASFAAMVSGQA